MKNLKPLLLLGLCAAMPVQAQFLSQLLNNAAQAEEFDCASGPGLDDAE